MAKQQLYTYSGMEKKLKEWEKRYSPAYFSLESLGLTYGKRHIYACHLGSPDASCQFAVTASIHGREYINTTLLMRIIDFYLSNYEKPSSPGEPSYLELWKNVCVSFIPMANPDGVSISMVTDARYWKENGKGIDLNRNFPSGFGQSPDRKKRNPGITPADQLETQYLMGFVNSLDNPVGIIHYHSRGNLIYYDYQVKGALRNRIDEMAAIAHKVTGYRLVSGTKDTKPAGGFGDWCVYEKKIPSITIETGFLKTPVPKWQLNGIYEKNLFLLRDFFACTL